MYVAGGTLTVTSSTLTGNQAVGGSIFQRGRQPFMPATSFLPLFLRMKR